MVAGMRGRCDRRTRGFSGSADAVAGSVFLWGERF